MFDRGLLEGEFTQTPTPLYYIASQVNDEVANLGKSLKLLRSTGTRYLAGQRIDPNNGQVTSAILPTAVTAWNAATDLDPYITQISVTNNGSAHNGLKGDVLIGHFEPMWDESGEKYFMIVNLLQGEGLSSALTSQNARLDFDFQGTSINSLQRLNRQTGEIETVPLVHDGGTLYHLDLLLAGGNGDLFKYNTGATFIVDNGITDLSGDYNRDGAVDAADYVMWRKTFGQNVTLSGSGADGDGDGIIGQGDYSHWRNRFGNTNGGGQSASSLVPELAPVQMMILLIVGTLFWRRSKELDGGSSR